MKRLVLMASAMSLSLALLSCGGGSQKGESTSDDAYGEYEIAPPEGSESTATEQSAAPAEQAPAASNSDAIAEGKVLVDASDCRTCHHPTNKIIGPAHTDVAKKYDFTEANVKLLASKIIEGGSGVWGDIMMNPHPSVSQEDAEKMARYVLSLDGETEH